MFDDKFPDSNHALALDVVWAEVSLGFNLLGRWQWRWESFHRCEVRHVVKTRHVCGCLKDRRRGRDWSDGFPGCGPCGSKSACGNKHEHGGGSPFFFGSKLETTCNRSGQNNRRSLPVPQSVDAAMRHVYKVLMEFISAVLKSDVLALGPDNPTARQPAAGIHILT
jgi:hypothetical protein